MGCFGGIFSKVAGILESEMERSRCEGLQGVIAFPDFVQIVGFRTGFPWSHLLGAETLSFKPEVVIVNDR